MEIKKMGKWLNGVSMEIMVIQIMVNVVRVSVFYVDCK